MAVVALPRGSSSLLLIVFVVTFAVGSECRCSEVSSNKIKSLSSLIRAGPVWLAMGDSFIPRQSRSKFNDSKARPAFAEAVPAMAVVPATSQAVLTRLRCANGGGWGRAAPCACLPTQHLRQPKTPPMCSLRRPIQHHAGLGRSAGAVLSSPACPFGARGGVLRAIMGLVLLHPRSVSSIHGDLLAIGGGGGSGGGFTADFIDSRGVGHVAGVASICSLQASVTWWEPKARCARHAGVRDGPPCPTVTRSIQLIYSLSQYGWRVELAERSSTYLVCCSDGSGEAALSVRFNFSRCSCGSNLLSPVKPPSYLRLKTIIILEDTGRSDSRGERRLYYRSARMRTFDVSIVATSRGSRSPDWPCAPDGSIIHVFASKSAVSSYICSVIWEFISHTNVMCFIV